MTAIASAIIPRRRAWLSVFEISTQKESYFAKICKVCCQSDRSPTQFSQALRGQRQLIVKLENTLGKIRLGIE
jgi:hypothetical protein